MSIIQDIRNNKLAPCYLLYGEEKYLLDQELAALRAYFAADEENSLNIQIFEGGDITLAELLREAATVSFFAAKKLLIVKGCPYFTPIKGEDKSGKNKALLEEYLNAPTPDCCIAMIADAIPDKRTAMYKLIAKKAAVAEYAPLKKPKQINWLQERFAAAGRRAKPELLNEISVRMGGSLYAMASEADKIMLATDKTVIALADCEGLLSPSAELSVFELIDAISGRKGKTALKLYEEMLARGEAAQKIAVLLLKQFHNMLVILDMKRLGLSREAMKRELNCDYDFIINKLSAFAAEFTAGELMRNIDAILKADYTQKSGGRAIDAALKELILKISSK